MPSLEIHPIPSSQPAPANCVVGTFIAEINHAVHSCKGWSIQAGLLLLDAKAKLPHGEWTAMFESGQLNVTLRVAEMLMKIANHTTLANPKSFSFLPPGWSILYELSKLPAEVLEKQIRSGAVHPDLTLKDGRQIVHKCQADGAAPTRKSPAKAFNLETQRKRLSRYFLEQVTRWPADQHLELAQLLETLAAQIRKGGLKP